MSPGEERLLAFIASRLESMLRRPAVWGALLSIEERVLQLLELRRMLLVPTSSPSDTHKLLRAYSRFIAETLEDASVEPLATQLERRGRTDEFGSIMRAFVAHEEREFLVDAVGLDEPGIERSSQGELVDRVLNFARAQARAEARQPVPVPQPIEFPHRRTS